MSAKKLTMPTIRTNRRANFATFWPVAFIRASFCVEDLHPSTSFTARVGHALIISFFISLHVVEQRHEAEVHVELLVAMEKRQTGIVRNKVDLCFLISAEHDHVFENSG